MIMTKYPIIVFILIILIVLAFGIVRMYFLFQKSIALETIMPFKREVPDAKFRILVLGDSTAFGTGADNPASSTAGRLGQKYPDAEVVNLAENGLRIAGLEEILMSIDEDVHFDIVLIQIGANDIIRLTSMQDVESGIDRILERSKKFGGKTIVLHSGDIGEAKFFPWFLRPILSYRSLGVRDIYKRVSPAHGAEYVDLVASPVSKLLKDDIEHYYSADLLHLSSEGYGLWYREIESKI